MHRPESKTPLAPRPVLPPGRRPLWGSGLLVAVLGLLSGCSTLPEEPLSPARPVVPEEAFVVQRAVLTWQGRQFPMNGYLARSRTRGLRLVLNGPLGTPLADVLLTSQGEVHVQRSSELLSEDWIRDYLVWDLKGLYGDGDGGSDAWEQLEPDVYHVGHPRYELEVRVLEVRPGPQAPGLFVPAPAASP